MDVTFEIFIRFRSSITSFQGATCLTSILTFKCRGPSQYTIFVPPGPASSTSYQFCTCPLFQQLSIKFVFIQGLVRLGHLGLSQYTIFGLPAPPLLPILYMTIHFSANLLLIIFCYLGLGQVKTLSGPSAVARGPSVAVSRYVKLRPFL